MHHKGDHEHQTHRPEHISCQTDNGWDRSASAFYIRSDEVVPSGFQSLFLSSRCVRLGGAGGRQGVHEGHAVGPARGLHLQVANPWDGGQMSHKNNSNRFASQCQVPTRRALMYF